MIRGTSLAIVGAGPIGLEAALYARRLGYAVTVLEAGEVGQHVRRWGHVRMFSPWSMNVSTLGAATLREGGWEPPDPDACPTGDELVDRYLAPLAASGPLAASVRTGVRVRAIGREGVLKGERIGDPRRAEQPFRLLLEAADGERIERFERVIDCSGVYGQPNRLGVGGVAAPGERAAADRIAYHAEDILGATRERYAGHRVLLVGAGHSAATAACALAQLVRDEPGTRVVWATRSRRWPPVVEIGDDPLPERARLAAAANRLAADPPEGMEIRPGRPVQAVRPHCDALAVTLDDGEEVVADRVVALTGYRPDLELCRELQVHTCWATEGPMKLAAALLADGNADCLAQASPGPETMAHPEPGLLWLGQKAYGRNPAFLLRVGREQIRDGFRLWHDDSDLDLY